MRYNIIIKVAETLHANRQYDIQLRWEMTGKDKITGVHQGPFNTLINGMGLLLYLTAFFDCDYSPRVTQAQIQGDFLVLSQQ